MHRLLVRACFAAFLAAAPAAAAFAHAYLSRAIPPAGATVTAPPREVRCSFTEELEPDFSTLEVKNAAGTRVDTGKMHMNPQDAKQMVIGLKPLTPGVYTVTWHAVSVDTHHTQGHFSFTVAR